MSSDGFFVNDIADEEAVGRADAPLVTVVVPCYNVELYIRRCLDSVLSSTYHDIEILAINDGSTDGTLGVLDDYRGMDRLTVLSQQNMGLSATRNRGIELAAGEYIMFVDSDDWIDSRMIELIVSEAVKTAADLVVSDLMLVVEHEDRPDIVHPLGLKMPICSSEKETLNKYFAGLIGLSVEDIAIWNSTGSIDRLKVHGYAGSKLYRTDIIRNEGIRFDHSVDGTEDAFNMDYALSCSSTACVNEPLYFYRIRADRSNSVANRSGFPRKAYSYKMGALHARCRLRGKQR